MNTSKLKEQDGFFLCPSCGEFELQQLSFWDAQGKDHATDEFQCDNQTCEAKFIEDTEGELIIIK